MFKATLFIIIILHLSCASHYEIIGTWKANKYSSWERGIAYLKGTRGLVKGKELILNPDSSYIKTFRGAISTGKWHVENDSLFLISSIYIIQPNDSISVADDLTYRRNPQEWLTIRQNKLIQYYRGNYCKRRKSDGSIEYKDNFIMEILRRSE